MKSIPSMSLKTKAMKSLGRKVLCVLLSGVFFGDTIAWAEAPILPDTTAPGNRYPLVSISAGNSQWDPLGQYFCSHRRWRLSE